jgi:hypothetical protein
MRIPALRVAKFIVAAFLLAAGLSGQRAAAQFNPIQAAKDAYNKAKQQQQQQGQTLASAQPAAAPSLAAGQPSSSPSSTGAQPSTPAASAPNAQAAAAAGPTGVPAAPAGGINPSKLPDIQGIHLGMTPQDLLPKLNVLYPTGKGPFAYGVKLSNAQYLHAPDKPWVATVVGTLDCSSGNCGSDVLSVIFSAPPSKQVAVFLQRDIAFQGGKFPTPDTLIASLTQKYGPNPIMLQPNLLGWAFDEQGQPLVPAPLKSKLGNACPVSNIFAPSHSIERYAGLLPLSQADINLMVTQKCGLGVYVFAQLALVNGGVVAGMTVKMIENSEDLRDAIAGQQYLDSVAAAQQQQQLKNAQGQSVPKL